ncbi:MAG: hypothetical protein M1277_00515 [Patescibacteria group bacterium]|nr:hypothetical protein [Patescibacteria group bacterium]
MEIIKDKKFIIATVCIVVIVLIVGGYFLLFAKKSVQKSAQTMPQVQDKVVPTLSPSSIGLSLIESPDKKKVTLKISKTEDIVSVDYQLSYVSKGNIPRGIIGHLDVKNPGSPIKQDITLGTCSDVCHYDQDVKNIKVILNVTKTDGKSYAVEESL